MKKIVPIPLELLAPARNKEFGIAAINQGADAVYIGSPNFGARNAAANSLTDIEHLVQYAHFYKTKVYTAFNTLLFDDELERAEILIHHLYNLGIDGLIIQDMGILELTLPPVPLIASTQTHNTSPEKIRFFEAVGFKRVILARELSLEEICNIRRNTTIELESFVHGALCVSYSGQCYMSQAICNRSGNRGACAQPCRSRYDLVDARGKIIEKDKYLLSLKDLNLSQHLDKMIDAGITSFKIEGRLKDISYVKNVVSHYRQMLDTIIAGRNDLEQASSGKSILKFKPDPEKSFNRGFTSFNIEGRQTEWGTYDTQKAMGKYVGIVSKVADNYFIMSGEELVNGDGICFFDIHRNLLGTNINVVKDHKIFPGNIQGIKEGMAIYRNNDSAFEKQLLLTSDRRIGVHLELSAQMSALRLKITDDENNIAIIEQEGQFIESEKQDIARHQIIRQLSKLGDTAYYPKEISLTGDIVPFLSPGNVNNLRREAVNLLNKVRNEVYEKAYKPFIVSGVPYPEKQLSYMANITNEKSRQFFTRHQSEVLEMGFEKTTAFTGKALMTTKHCIRYQYQMCPVYQLPKGKFDEPVYLKDNKHKYRLRFDCKRCVMEIIFEK